MSGAADPAGAFALVLSIALLCVRRIGTGVRVCMLQALLAAIALGASGRGSAVVAPLAFLLNGVALPLALQRVTNQREIAMEPWRFSGSVWLWPAALVILIVIIAAFHGTGPGNLPTLGASIVLFGLLLVARGPLDLSRVLGLLSSQNGIVVLAGSISETPPATLLIAAVPLVPALVLTEVWRRR